MITNTMNWTDQGMPSRKNSLRYTDCDYSTVGFYFVTICCQNAAHRFGYIENSQLNLNFAGNMITHEWNTLPNQFPQVRLHEMVVMPNHFHGIIEISNREGSVDQKDPSLSKIVGAFKSRTTVKYIEGVKTAGWKPFHKKLWQRGFRDSILRSRQAFRECSRYINNNPAKWHESLKDHAALHKYFDSKVGAIPCGRPHI